MTLEMERQMTAFTNAMKHGAKLCWGNPDDACLYLFDIGGDFIAKGENLIDLLNNMSDDVVRYWDTK